MWLILPLVYVLAWKQTGSWRQAFNATIAWIIGFSIFAIAILAMDMGGYGGVRAMPDSPAAAIAILGGFIGMWTSNIIWRRRGGDPPRNPGRWERTFRAMFGGKPKKKKKRAPAPVAHQQPQRPAPQIVQPQPAEARYRPVAQQPVQPAPNQQNAAPYFYAEPQPSGPAPQYSAAQGAPGSYQPAPNQQPYPYQQPVYPQPQQAPRKPSQSSRQSPTANKYAKATGRALAAMLKGPKPKRTKKPRQ